MNGIFECSLSRISELINAVSEDTLRTLFYIKKYLININILREENLQ